MCFSGDKLNAVDIRLAGLIARRDYEAATTYAHNVIFSDRPDDVKKAAEYWRDLALMLMEAEQQSRQGLEEEMAFEMTRWSSLPPELHFKLISTLINELNHKLVRHKKLSRSNKRLYANNSELQKEKKKLERLLQELETVK
ncbi:hypothetical protein ACFL5V_05130 [Fibrobacterota bacterium]